MDLGLTGKSAIVCASSAGLGRACARELAFAGCTVVMNGRNPDTLRAAAEAVRAETGATILTVPGDIGLAAVQEALLAAAPTPDILVTNGGGPPLRNFRELDRAAIQAGIAANMITPIEMIQRVIDGMVDRRFGRVVNITSDTVKCLYDGLDLSSGARLGLTGFLAGVARSVAHANVTINFLLPGSFETERLVSVYQGTAIRTGKSYEAVRSAAEAATPARRIGDPEEFGAFCAFLCSTRAGYMTGQNILLDGGLFPATI